MSEKLLEAAVAAARAGGAELRERFRDPAVEAEAKAANDLVSEADRASERAIVGTLLERFPDDRILSEEVGWVGREGSGTEWIVDPLDGTSNFLQGLPIYAVSVACRRDGELEAGAILDPERGDLFTARRGGGALWNGRPARVSARRDLEGSFLATGYPFRAKAALDLYLAVFADVFGYARSIRRCGAAALDLAHTAVGVFDGFFEFRLSAWDIAAGALLIREAGGAVCDLDGGERFLDSGNVLAGPPELVERLRELVGRHVDEARLDAVVPNVTAPSGRAC